jgi:hypothetical protein
LDGIDLNAICYALNACQRMDARLDVLTNLLPEVANRAIMETRGTLDTPWRLIPVRGEHGDEVLRYAKNEPALLFITASARDEKASRLRARSEPGGVPLGVSWLVVDCRQ